MDYDQSRMTQLNLAQKVRHVANNPGTAFRYVNRINRTGNDNGVKVFDQDWDNLLILDACRYDYFARELEPELDGTLTRVESRGAATDEWLEQNFDGRTLHDTVYVSANGRYLRVKDRIECSLHDARWLCSDDDRNDLGSVEPGVLADEALSADAEYPNKRLLVHFVQPHRPFVGPTARKYFAHTRTNEGLISYREMLRQSDGADLETLRSAYRESVQATVSALQRLIQELSGKTVVSADHGEMLGERYLTMPFRNYGHVRGLYVPELVEVPWFECESSERKRL